MNRPGSSCNKWEQGNVEFQQTFPIFRKKGVDLPDLGDYVAGIIFMHKDSVERGQCEASFEKLGLDMGLEVIAWRDVPVNSPKLGAVASKTEPALRQVFMRSTNDGTQNHLNLGMRAFILRKWAQKK